MSLDTFRQHFLEFMTPAFGAHFPGDKAAGLSVDKGQDVDPVFFSSMKVSVRQSLPNGLGLTRKSLIHQ